ncbi:LAMP3 protein, partial [Acrocephalus arundinaceus]|nr:LAMP3 protein [Acrocephalus arundinaceus]
ASQATTSVTAAVENTTTPCVSSTRHGGRPRVTTETMAAATNSSLKHETPSTQGAAATTPSAATGTQRGNSSTRSQRQTTAMGSPNSTTATAVNNTTATAVNSTTTTHAGTHTAPTSPGSTVRPRPTPQPSGIPTGSYTLSDGNRTCIKAVMGLQLIARTSQQEQIEYVTVNPNATKISGSCGMVQSELNLTFSGGFVNITFVK